MTPTTTKQRTVRPSFLPLADSADQGKRYLLPCDHWQSNRCHFGMMEWYQWNTHWRPTSKMGKIRLWDTKWFIQGLATWIVDLGLELRNSVLQLLSTNCHSQCEEISQRSNGWCWASERSLETIHFCVYVSLKGRGIIYHNSQKTLGSWKSQEPRKAGFNLACVLFPTKSCLDMLSPLGTYLYMMAQPYH